MMYPTSFFTIPAPPQPFSLKQVAIKSLSNFKHNRGSDVMKTKTKMVKVFFQSL